MKLDQMIAELQAARAKLGNVDVQMPDYKPVVAVTPMANGIFGPVVFVSDERNQPDDFQDPLLTDT